MQILYYYLNYFIGTKNVNLELLFNSFIIIFLLFLNGFFVAAEFSLVGVRKTRILQLSEEGNFSAKLAMDALKNIDKYIAAVQLGITIASLGLGWVGESTLARIIKPLFEFLPGDIDSVAAHTVSVTTAFILSSDIFNTLLTIEYFNIFTVLKVIYCKVVLYSNYFLCYIM